MQQRFNAILLKGKAATAVAHARRRVQALSAASLLCHSPSAATPWTAMTVSACSLLRPQPLGMRFFTPTPTPAGGMADVVSASPLVTPVRAVHAEGRSGSFLRAARLSLSSASRSSGAAGSLRFTPFYVPHRRMSVRGKDGGDEKTKTNDSEANKEEEGGEKAENEENADGNKGEKKQKAQQQQKKNSFADHLHGLKEDYMKFPDIYNSANGINFIIFTVFCLCSTGSNTEEKWWLEQWGLDNTLRPWNWLLHSFLTNNFLSMTFAMMLLHTLCHAMIPTIGSQGLFAYVVATAVLSGAVMWCGNRLYYGNEAAPEKQFGPWDVVHALLVMHYLQYAITPVTVLNSFNSWLKYAVWVGEVCILYFDWQPTLVGAVVGLALCKGVPRFRVKPVA